MKPESRTLLFRQSDGEAGGTGLFEGLLAPWIHMAMGGSKNEAVLFWESLYYKILGFRVVEASTFSFLVLVKVDIYDSFCSMSV